MKIGNQHVALLWRMARMLSNPLQAFVMLRCLRQKNIARKEVIFRIRRLDGKPLICRAGTTDAAVLYDTFCGLYHLPHHHLRSDATIVDLGTNVGYVAAHLAELYPRARIIGLELDAANADMARRNLAQYGDNCSVLTAAIWTHDGSVPYGGEGEWGFKVIERDSEESAQGPQRTAQAISMNTLIRQHKIGKIDFLKMDIEGGEFALLRNSPDWLKNVQAINVEIHDPDRVEEIAKPLISSGFLVQRDQIHWCQLIGIRL